MLNGSESFFRINFFLLNSIKLRGVSYLIRCKICSLVFFFLRGALFFLLHNLRIKSAHAYDIMTSYWCFIMGITYTLGLILFVFLDFLRNIYYYIVGEISYEGGWASEIAPRIFAENIRH